MNPLESITQEQSKSVAFFRNRILKLESMLKDVPGALIGDNDLCPLKHKFAGGIYMREIFIPKDTLIVGKIHRHSHPNVLLKGDVSVWTEGGGVERLKAPMAMISPPGTKRLVYTHEDSTWITFHSVGEETDPAKCEEMIIAPTYEAYEKGLLQ